MIKTKLAVIIDTFIISITLTFLIFAWLKRYIKNAFFICFVCIFAFILLFIAIFKHFSKKHNLDKIKFKDIKIAENSFNFLKYCSLQNYENFFEKLLNSTHIISNIFESETHIFYINLKTITTDNDFKIANEYFCNCSKNKDLVFITDSTSTEFNTLLANSPTKFYLYTKPELFELMKDKNIFPINHKIPSKLKSFKLPNLTLSRARFKELFFSGLSLLIIAMIIPYTFYYLLIGSILLILSLISLFKKAPSLTHERQDLKNLIKEKDNVIKS